MLFKLLTYGLLLWLAVWGYRQYQQPSQRLSVGALAPDFTLPDQAGQSRSLKDWQGQWLILYFYPKDDTPGCTREACHFRDDIQQFRTLGAQVVGISVDTVASHGDFARKHGLQFPLLADTNGKVADRYGALFDLVVFQAARRMTYLIDPQGRIAQSYVGVDPDRHSQALLADLKRLSAH
ncbi:MAG TPA: peroxiredoxin [Methylophilus sp.]